MLLDWLEKITLPLVPLKTELASMNRSKPYAPVELPSATAALLRVSPPVTLMLELPTAVRSSAKGWVGSPSTTTPAKVPPVPVPINRAPSLTVTVPPLIVPPARFQDPVIAFSASVVPVLVKVPVRLTVPPERLRVASCAWVKVPPRFSVLLVALTLPGLVQAPSRVRVPPPSIEIMPALDPDPEIVKPPPLEAWIMASLLQPVALIVRVPAPSARIVPWLTTLTLAGPPKLGL